MLFDLNKMSSNDHTKIAHYKTISKELKYNRIEKRQESRMKGIEKLRKRIEWIMYRAANNATPDTLRFIMNAMKEKLKTKQEKEASVYAMLMPPRAYLTSKANTIAAYVTFHNM